MDRARLIEIGERLGEEDRGYAEALRRRMARSGCYVVNVMGSPGAGKTSLILATLARLPSALRAAVVEADLDSSVDAEAIEAAGYPAVQLHTGGFCHLDARMTARGLSALGLPAEAEEPALPAAAADRPAGQPHAAAGAGAAAARLDLVFVENVGNLICTAQEDAGAHLDLALLSLPEGDDKPLKYPVMFRAADAVLVTKLDFAAVQDFDLDAFRERVRFLNPAAPVFALSARRGEGMDEWLAWLLSRIEAATPGSAR